MVSEGQSEEERKTSSPLLQGYHTARSTGRSRVGHCRSRPLIPKIALHNRYGLPLFCSFRSTGERHEDTGPQPSCYPEPTC